MRFRVSCIVDDLAHKMCDEPITYDLDGPPPVHVIIERRQETDELLKVRLVAASCSTCVELLESEGLRDLSSAIRKSGEGPGVNFHGVQDLTKGIYEIVDPVFRALRSDLTASIAILRWRYGITDSAVNSMSKWSEDVSLDGYTWRGISTLRGFSMIFSRSFTKLDSSAAAEVSRLHKEGAEPPLALQLINEARNQRTEHPRSSLVIAVTAAEVAIKQLIGTLAPDARWLAENMPSPPIFKILKDYVPKLKVRAKFSHLPLRPPKKLLTRLNEAVELRNKVVHAGEAPPGRDKLLEIIDAMEDVVWVCVLYGGHPWAGYHISHDTTSAWAKTTE
jgi:hypothetical protein